MGCLPPEVEPGRYTQTPYQRGICKLYSSMWRDQKHFLLFLSSPATRMKPAFQSRQDHTLPLTLWPCYVVGPLESKLGSLKKARFVLSLRSLPCRKKVNPLNLQLPFPYLLSLGHGLPSVFNKSLPAPEESLTIVQAHNLI